MSALPPKADKVAGISVCPLCANRVLMRRGKKTPPLFDHLVGEGEQLVWKRETERLRGPEIDH